MQEMDDAYTYFDMFTRNRLEKHKYSSMRIQIDTEVLLRNRKTTIEEQWVTPHNTQIVLVSKQSL